MRRSAGVGFDDAPVMLSYTNDGGSSPTFHRSRRYVAYYTLVNSTVSCQ